MIEAVAQDGARLFINPDGIWHIRDSGADTTAIYSTTGATLFVRGAVEDVASRIASWQHDNRLRLRSPRLHIVEPDED